MFLCDTIISLLKYFFFVYLFLYENYFVAAHFAHAWLLGKIISETTCSRNFKQAQECGALQDYYTYQS